MPILKMPLLFRDNSWDAVTYRGYITDGGALAYTQIRALPGLDEIVIDVRGLHPNRAFTAYVHFFANNYDRIILCPALH